METTVTTADQPASPHSRRANGAGRSRIAIKQTMRAAILTAPGEFSFREVPVPTPGEGQIRLRLEGCGVCGSNLAPWEGRPWFQYPFEPGSPGHEGWGIVDAIGPNVTQVMPGERVAALACHSFAEYDIASEESVVHLPPRLNALPFPGEALGCAMNVFRRSDIYPGQTVAILGIGFLGAILTALCAHAGAKVVASSRRPFALDTARRAGATECIPLDNPGQVAERIASITSGRGCDCVIEATGFQQPLDLAGELTRESGRLVIAGYHQDGLRQVNLQLWNWRGLEVINAHERNRYVCRAGIEAAAEAIAAGALDPAPLYTHRFAFSDLHLALNSVKDRPDGFLKALIIHDRSDSHH